MLLHQNLQVRILAVFDAEKRLRHSLGSAAAFFAVTVGTEEPLAFVDCPDGHSLYNLLILILNKTVSFY